MKQHPIPTGSKYALYALRTSYVSDELADGVKLGGGLSALRSLPIAFPAHWERWLGELQVKELSQASLFLLATAPATKLSDLDDENTALTERVNRFFFALLIALPSSIPLEGMHLTGAAADDQPDVRRQGRLDAITSTVGATLPEIDGRILHAACELAAGLEAIQRQANYRRLWRLVHALHVGMTSRDLGSRTHQFVRCVEGFLLPEIGKTRRQFAHRCQVFVGPHHRSSIKRLFDLRSAVEHLHDPLRVLDEPDERARILRLGRCAHQAEAVARFCLSRVLASETLWPHFSSDESIRKYWQLGLTEQKELWGEPLDFEAASNQFDPRMAALELRI